MVREKLGIERKHVTDPQQEGSPPTQEEIEAALSIAGDYNMEVVA